VGAVAEVSDGALSVFTAWNVSIEVIWASAWLETRATTAKAKQERREMVM
jgi:hypothetical protein